jgi:membrane protease YdiL (CAAX protease family)
MDMNQEPPPDQPPPTADDAALIARIAEADARRAERLHAADAVGGAMRKGLLRWTLVTSVGALAALVLQRFEAALLLAVAALFALAQSWDTRDRARTGDPVTDLALAPGGVGAALRLLVPLIVPVAGTLAFTGLALYARSLPHDAARVAALQWCVAAGAVCLLNAIPAVNHMLARTFVRGGWIGHTARLTASIALVLLLLPVPFQLLLDDLMSAARSSGKPLAEVGGLVGQLVGEVAFALAAVGLWVGRDLRAVRERLGLGGMSARHWGIAVLGLGAVLGANSGMEWVERTHFHALWLQDQDMVRLMAADLSLAATLVLGVSAGIGEEVLVRGALQPRMGLLWASLLFAAAHVQYTWFGMLTIALLGLVLGVVRIRANTTTAIVVHALYDIFAAIGSQ